MNLIRTIIEKRWTLTGIICENGSSTLYRASDRRRRNSEAAVKVFKRDARTLLVEEYRRFFSDLKTISGISHPNIPRVIGYGSLVDEGGERFYVICEYFSGKTLPDTEKSVEKIIEIIKAAADLLDAVHSRGIIHASLKTKNILVGEGASPQVRVTDFGSLRHNDDRRLRETGYIESVRYMSPEACGMTGRTLDARSDLYSLGVIFYFLLTGTYPADGDTADTVRHMHAAKIPPLPSSLNNSVTPELDVIVMKLLAKNPEQRYPSAWKLLDDIRLYNEKVQDSDAPHGINPVMDVEFIGREKELSALKDLLPSGPSGSICFVMGESGCGKTSLVKKFGLDAKKNGFVFIHGKCSPGENTSPFRPFIEALEMGIDIFKSYPAAKKKEIAADVNNEFGDGIEELSEFLPSVRLILDELPVKAKENHFPAKKPIGLVSCIMKMIRLISLKEKGLILFIDDIQWIDDDSRNLVDELAGGISSTPLLLLCASRNGAAAENISSTLSGAVSAGEPGKIVKIGLKSMDEGCSGILISRIIGDDEADLSEVLSFVNSVAKGNPFFTIELVRYIISSGSLNKNGAKWNVAKKNEWSFNVSTELIDLITERINLIRDNERTVFMLASAYGRSFSKTFMETLADIYGSSGVLISGAGGVPGWGDVSGIILSGFSNRFIASDPLKKNEYFFWHDKIAEAFYSLIPDKHRKEIHRIVAAACEELLSEGDENFLFDTANHFIIAGDTGKIIKYAPAAAGAAAKMNALEESIRLYTVSLDNLEKNGAELNSEEVKIRLACLAGLGESLLISGRYEQAIEIYGRLLEKVSDRTGRVEIYEKLCTAYFKKGDWRKAEECGKTGLALIGESLPINGLAVFTSSVKEFLRHLFLLSFSELYKTGRSGRLEKSARPAINFYNTLNWMYLLSDTAKFVRSILRMLNISLVRIGKSPELALSMGAYASLCMSIPLFGRAEKYHRIALRMREDLGDEWGTAQSLQWMGYMFQWKGDLESSTRYLNRAVSRFRKLGDAWETGMAIHGLELNNVYSGNYASAESQVKNFIDISRMSGDLAGVCGGYNDLVWIKTEKGDFARAKEFSAAASEIIEKQGLAFHRCINESHRGRLCMMEGDFSRAVDFLKSARRLYYGNKFIDHYVIQLFPDLAEAFILDITGSDKGGGLPDKKALSSAKKLCKEAVARTKKWPLYSGDALRICAMFYAVSGKKFRADKFYRRSIDIHKKYGRRFNLAAVSADYGHFLLNSGRQAESAVFFRNACTIFDELDLEFHKTGILKTLENIETGRSAVTVKSSVYDKKNPVTGREKEADTDRTAASKMLNYLIRITAAERGYIFVKRGETGDIIEVCGSSLNDESRADIQMEAVRDTFSSGLPYLLINSDGNGEHQTSIICDPVISDRRIIAVCYLENSITNGVFSADTNNMVLEYLDINSALFNGLKIDSFADRCGYAGGSEQDNNNCFLSIKDDGVNHLIPYGDVIYMMSHGRYTVINTNNQSYQTHLLISKIETGLPEGFLRIHKQYIVNVDYVSSVKYMDSKRYMVYLKDEDDTVLHSGRKYSAAIRQKFDI